MKRIYTMTRAEAFAGAPILRGRWAAIWWLWWAGEFWGETSLFNGVSIVEWVIMAFGALFLVIGVLSLDQYGRNAWFAWAPDDATWSGLPRAAVNRQTRFPFPRRAPVEGENPP